MRRTAPAIPKRLPQLSRCVVIPYQAFIELRGSIYIVNHLVKLIFAGMNFEEYFLVIDEVKTVHIKQYLFLYFVYLLLEIFLTCHEEYLDYEKWYVHITKMPEAVATVVLGTLFAVPLAIARLGGMISFWWRRRAW